MNGMTSGIRSSDLFIRHVLLVIVPVLLVCTACLFEGQPEEPGYPSQLDATVSFQDIGDPVLCKCMPGSDIALVAAGSRLGVVQLQAGQLQTDLDTGIAIDDVSDSQAGGYAWVLADSLLFPVDVSQPSILDPVRLDGAARFVTARSSDDFVAVVMEDDSLYTLDVTTMEGSTVPGISFPDCQGLEYGGDNTIYAVIGSENAIAGYYTDSWQEIGRISVPGDAIDFFPGPSGYICAIVSGSNELWFIRTSDCKLYKMITFPETPVSAASMPDGVYAFAACTGSGLLVVAESGQVEMRTVQFGIPSSIDVSPDGGRAVLCNSEERAVYILVR